MIKWPIGCESHCGCFDCADKGQSIARKSFFCRVRCQRGADKVIRDEQAAGRFCEAEIQISFSQEYHKKGKNAIRTRTRPNSSTNCSGVLFLFDVLFSPAITAAKHCFALTFRRAACAYPSIAMYLFSSSLGCSFFGTDSLRIPSSNFARISLCSTPSPM